MSQVDHALDLLAPARLVVLTGAGLSTDSGIPDYRGPGSVPRSPMTFQEFIATATARQRYWGRAHVGWARMGRAEPNLGHRSVARLGAELVITQNVDGLHERVCTPHLVALHGRIADVICLDCGAASTRAAMNLRLEELNPGWAQRHADVATRPDGDVALEETADFVVPACLACGGRLKPDVVFFGESVPKPRVQRCFDAVESLAGGDRPGALLVLGSSLTVMSGLRFVRRARAHAVPIVIVNRGDTRGDELADFKLATGTSEFSAALAERRAELEPVQARGLGVRQVNFLD